MSEKEKNNPAMPRSHRNLLIIVLILAAIGILIALAKPLWLNPAIVPAQPATSLFIFALFPLIWIFVFLILVFLPKIRLRVVRGAGILLIVCAIFSVGLSGVTSFQAMFIQATGFDCAEATNPELGDPQYTQWICRAALIGDTASVYVFEGDADSQFVRLIENKLCSSDCQKFN